MKVIDSTGMPVTQDAYDAYVRSVGKLTQELSLAEEGLANYAQEVERLTKERDKYKEVLRICSREAERQLRDELHRIRNQSLEWAMVCTCNCPACCALYETIKGSSGHPKGSEP